MIREGIEPTDRTEKGQAARVAMFLPRRKRKPSVMKEAPAPAPSLEWWGRVEKKAIQVMVNKTKKSLKQW